MSSVGNSPIFLPHHLFRTLILIMSSSVDFYLFDILIKCKLLGCENSKPEGL